MILTQVGFSHLAEYEDEQLFFDDPENFFLQFEVSVLTVSIERGMGYE